ncbi:FMN-binding split barrel-like protein [Penicillium malachiteum]|uniref:FMN-binding split barrel-like protein n=1 Tax=Penicillium malachiteum TaxID=1324776 RepID=UPI002548A957|nr:FMN-binding split barrel-like protein [Penicillium malachiteum]KAJ5715649.1 FMN-binding split barrel-like protein [Penicillium malachiteum]
MFYQPGITDHGLPHDPFKACVVPRPIGWISTMNKKGQANLAPYSQFNNLSFDPPLVMFSSNQTSQENRKDTVVNAEQTGKFVWNLATWDLREAVNISAEQVPYGVDEFERAGLAKEPGTLTGIPMVRDSPIKFECEYLSTLRIPGNAPMGSVDVVIGRVVGIHIKDEVLVNGLIEVSLTKPIARCGYFQYTVVEKTFDMIIPGMSEDVLYGLEGNSRKNREADARRKDLDV